VERYKARLVERGFTQTYGVDYNETFAPVAKFTSIRSILALAALEDMDIHQMDVKIAFLNGELEEEIYMEQPQGFVHQGGEHLVCKLQKSLYGLKQSPRAWNQKLDAFLKSIEFMKSEVDPRMRLTLPIVGTWSPQGLPKTQSSISGVKTPRIGVFFISMERS
jgi:hypothetical protein